MGWLTEKRNWFRAIERHHGARVVELRLGQDGSVVGFKLEDGRVVVRDGVSLEAATDAARVELFRRKRKA